MSQNKLTPRDLAQYRSFITRKLLPLIARRREQLIQENFVDLSFKLSHKETELNSIVSRLAITEIQEIVTDLSNVGTRLEQVTNKVEAAIAELKDINKVIGVLTSFVNIFRTILGGQPIAAIAQFINDIDRLSARA
ncbi:MAG: hypothetical protein SAK29_16955 [Scytonema sp. PMC 1069.18]|nr:hypothetical protein [Scytonema sp. PMC 1069.18]MEC4882247.1 hypothetical protein [Scytonema sp. PMC 1070.18]